MKKLLITKILIMVFLVNSNLYGDDLGVAIGGTLGLVGGLAFGAGIYIKEKVMEEKKLDKKMEELINDTIKQSPWVKDWRQIVLAINKKDLDALKKVLNPNDPNLSDKINCPLFLPLSPIKLTFGKGLEKLPTAVTFTYIATPLIYATKENFISGAKYLIKYGANVNESIKPIVFTFSKKLRGMRRPGEFTAPFRDDYINGFTPLHLAVVNGNEELVKLLLENGADINIKDPYRNQTPLDLAKDKIREYLIEHLNQINKKGNNYE